MLFHRNFSQFSGSVARVQTLFILYFVAPEHIISVLRLFLFPDSLERLLLQGLVSLVLNLCPLCV